MALRHFIMAVAGAAVFACQAPAQVTAETYRDAAGQTRDGVGVTFVAPIRAGSVPAAGTVTTGGAYQTALPASPARRGCLIVNRSAETQQVFIGAPASATAALSIPLAAGGTFNCGSPQGLVITDQISITAPTAGSAYLVVSQ